MAMVGVEAIPLPRIMAEHDTRAEFSNGQCHASPGVEVAVELAVDIVEETHLTRLSPGEAARGLALFDLASSRPDLPRCQLGKVGLLILDRERDPDPRSSQRRYQSRVGGGVDLGSGPRLVVRCRSGVLRCRTRLEFDDGYHSRQ